MAAQALPGIETCNCLAVRKAARRVTQFYDRFLAPTGLRTTQFSILGRLKRSGPTTINALADHLAMDRTTLGRNILPLQREGLIEIAVGGADRRSRDLRLTRAGEDKLRHSYKKWAEAQMRFEAAFGGDRALDLRGLLRDVVAADLARTGDVKAEDLKAEDARP